MKVSAIVPVFNEEKTISIILNKLLSIKEITQIIVVNDASTDKSEEKIRQILRLRSGQVRLINHSKNLGKGAAVRTGLRYVKYPLTFIQDADLEYNPHDLKKLLRPYSLVPRTYPLNIAVFGSRLLTQPFPKDGYIATLAGNHVITWFTNLLFGTELTDSYTCYKLIPTKILKRLELKSDKFEIEAEITAKLALNKVQILEVPISYHPRSYAKGKKIGILDFFKAISTLLKFRFPDYHL